jgi:hypothetical protein
MALPAVHRSPTESIAMSEGYSSYPLGEYSAENRCVDRRYRLGKKEGRQGRVDLRGTGSIDGGSLYWEMGVSPLTVPIDRYF